MFLKRMFNSSHPVMRSSSANMIASGMSLLEMVVAMLMLVMFTGVVVAVLEVTARFSSEVREMSPSRMVC